MKAARWQVVKKAQDHVSTSAHQDESLPALLTRHCAQGSWCCQAQWHGVAFDHLPETDTFNSSSTWGPGPPGVGAP